MPLFLFLSFSSPLFLLFLPFFSPFSPLFFYLHTTKSYQFHCFLVVTPYYYIIILLLY